MDITNKLMLYGLGSLGITAICLATERGPQDADAEFRDRNGDGRPDITLTEGTREKVYFGVEVNGQTVYKTMNQILADARAEEEKLSQEREDKIRDAYKVRQ